MITLQIILEALLITLALSTDAFATGFAYGANKIKMPFLSILIINIICSAVLGASLFFGSLIGNYIPGYITLIICVVILIILGLIKIFDSYVKNLIKRKQGIDKKIKFSLLNLKFMLNIYATPENADVNRNKILSAKESIALAIALSLDGLTVGLGTGLTDENPVRYIIIIAFSLITGILLIIFGRFLGNKLAQKISINLSWLSGLILIGIAIMKIFV